MKIQLDYDAKIITLEDNVNLSDFFDKIKKILPDFKEWKLNTQTTINWTNPITIPHIPYYPRPYNPYPWYEWADTSTGSVTIKLDDTYKADVITTGTYCLELN